MAWSMVEIRGTPRYTNELTLKKIHSVHSCVGVDHHYLGVEQSLATHLNGTFVEHTAAPFLCRFPSPPWTFYLPRKALEFIPACQVPPVLASPLSRGSVHNTRGHRDHLASNGL